MTVARASVIGPVSRRQLLLRNVDKPARIARVVVGAEINLARLDPPPVVVVPGFQRYANDWAALLVPLLLAHARSPRRRPGAFEEVGQFLADRQLSVVDGHAAVIIV